MPGLEMDQAYSYRPRDHARWRSY